MRLPITIAIMFAGAATTYSSAAAQLVNPPKLVYSTYIGPDYSAAPAEGEAFLTAFTADSAGYTYVIGAYSGSPCPFSLLTKINQAGSAAVWSKCLSFANIRAVAVDGAGYVYVQGLALGVGNSGSAITFAKLSSDGQQVLNCRSLSGLVKLSPRGTVQYATLVDEFDRPAWPTSII
jgi:hypothetical protein